MVDDRRVIDQDIKRILVERDITTIMQAFYRILCSEVRNKDTRIFIPHKLFSQDRLQSYLFNKELMFGQLLLLLLLLERQQPTIQKIKKNQNQNQKNQQLTKYFKNIHESIYQYNIIYAPIFLSNRFMYFFCAVIILKNTIVYCSVH
jgi:hypothetical protein